MPLEWRRLDRRVVVAWMLLSLALALPTLRRASRMAEAACAATRERLEAIASLKHWRSTCAALDHVGGRKLNDMELSDALNVIHLGYTQSVGLLKGYLEHIGSAITKLQKEHSSLLGRLDAARLGEPDPGPPSAGEKSIKLELSAEEMDLVARAMKFAQGRTLEYPNLSYRMSFVYLIALFDAFLTDVFSEVARARPDILRSSKKQISYDRLLDLGSFDALVDFIASRELNELSYKSIKEQADYYRDRFGIALEDSGVPVSDLIELRSTRNLLVHNNGVVNHIYIELVPSTAYNAGDEVRVDANYFNQAAKSVEAVAAFITTKLVEKHAAKPIADGVARSPAS